MSASTTGRPVDPASAIGSADISDGLTDSLTDAEPEADRAVPRVQVRRDSGLYGYERALRRVGLAPVAGADEAGRGACAGPLVAAAVILSDAKSKQIDGLRDSKLLTAAQRERCYNQIVNRALAWSVVSIEPEECDRLGMHVANVEALRRALLRLEPTPTYVLTDGFSVDGLGVPGLSIWKGDRVAACVAAASVIAKVTRDRIMCELDTTYPEYRFAVHKGYCTPLHQEQLDRLGPSPTHRMRFDNVYRTVRPGMTVRTVPGLVRSIDEHGPEVEGADDEC
jgi:ribonuclease HII